MSDKKSKKTSLIKGGRAAENVRLRDKKKLKKSSQDWLERQINDPFVQQAKKDGYRSRAAYKLIEIDENFNILNGAKSVVDLGCAPGSWCQYASRKLGDKAKIVGVDLKEVDSIPNCILIKGDFTENEILADLLEKTNGKVDVVLSDMAPNSTGHSRTDHLQIMYLLELAIDFAVNNLKKNGSFVAKVLQGGAEKNLLDIAKKNFAKVKHYKPKASRQESAEMYIVATGFKF
ncbi:MAG: RlmE family RNA methyltransferase [Rickettsiales bacterium]|nr:RlmE family RNA methyltransferase [Rickettsiales bacterium]